MSSEVPKLIDLSKVPELVGRLQQPARVVEYQIAGIHYRVARGANDPTPDNVVQMAGMYFNLTDGRVSSALDGVV